MNVEEMALMIPILAIVLGVAIAIVSIVSSHRQKLKLAELRHRERLAAIEKGIELPLDPEPDADADAGKGRSLKSGLSGLLLGVLLYFALREVADDDIALFGLIPAALGIASLITYFVEGRGNGDARRAPPSP
jgi:hypothetical protein